MAANKPFCEISKKWMKEIKLPIRKLVEDHENFLLSILNKKADKILELQSSNNIKFSHSVITLYYSEYKYYLKLENLISKKDNFDNADLITHVVIDNIQIDKDFFLKIKSM